MVEKLSLPANKTPVFQVKSPHSLRPITHHCFLDINFLSTGQAKVCYLCYKVIADKNISSCQISVDELVRQKTI